MFQCKTKCGTGLFATQCIGVNSCTNSSITAGSIFACGGVYSCSNSIISPTTLTVGVGAYSLSNSIVFGPNSDKVSSIDIARILFRLQFDYLLLSK